MGYKSRELKELVPQLVNLRDCIQEGLDGRPNLLKSLKSNLKKQIIVSKNPTQKETTSGSQSSLLNSGKIFGKKFTLISSTTDTKAQIDKDDQEQDFIIDEDTGKKLLLMISQLELPEKIIQRNFKNFNENINEWIGKNGIIAFELSQVKDQINQVLEKLSNKVPQKIKDDVKEIIQYYENSFHRLLDGIQEKLDHSSPDSLKETLYEFIKQNSKDELVSVEGPFLQPCLVKTSQLNKLIASNSKIILKRIPVDLIHQLQKSLLIYAFNTIMMENQVQPTIVIRVKDVFKDKKTYTFFSVSFKPANLQNLEDFLFDTNTHELQSKENSKNLIKIPSFINNTFCSLLTLPFEHFTLKYGVDENGNIQRSFDHIQSKEDNTNHAGNCYFVYLNKYSYFIKALKNPLFFFKEILQEFNLKENDFFASLAKKDYLICFLDVLKFIIEAQKGDFSIRDNQIKYNSLLISEDQYQYIFQNMQKINQVLMWVKEVVLPTQGYFRLSEIMGKMYPIINEFISKQRSESLKDYTDFMKKISIEELLQKISSKRSLVKYKDCLRLFESNLRNTKPNCFESILNQWFLTFDLSLVCSMRHRLILLDFASKHYLFQSSPFSQEQIESSPLRLQDQWESVLNLFYNDQETTQLRFKPSVFLELLTISFNINMKEYDLFESVQNFDQTDDELALLQKYLRHPNFSKNIKLYADKSSLFEKSLKYKKFKLAIFLLKMGECKKLHPDSLSKYLIGNLTNDKNEEEEFQQILNFLLIDHKQAILNYQWNRIWKEIFVSNQSTSEDQMPIYGLTFGEKHVPKSIWEQAFEYDKGTKRYNLISSQTHKIQNLNNNNYAIIVIGQNQDCSLLIERANKYPGIVYMKDVLMKKLSPNSRLMKEFVKIQGHYYYFSQFNSSLSSFEKMANEGPFQIGENIDLEILSDRILLDMILYPENCSSSQFLVEKLENNKFGLVDIGSSEVFVYGIKRVNDEYEINVKSALFCLYEMNFQIDKRVLAKYETLDIGSILTEWLQELSKYQDQLIKIQKFSKGEQSESFFDQQEQPYFGIPIQKESIKHLIERFISIQKAVKYYKKQYLNISHQDLFHVVDKDLSALYSEINNCKSSFLSKKYDQVLQKLSHLQTFNSSNPATMVASFSERKRSEAISIETLVLNFKQIGPTHALEKLKKYLQIITFEENEQQFMKLQKVKNIKQLNYLTRNIKYNFIPLKTQEENLIKDIFELKTEKPIENFYFSNSSLTLKSLLLLTQSVDRIVQLIIPNTKISNGEIHSFAEQFKSLTYLDISGCDDISYIGSTKPLQFLMSSELAFPSLKTFVGNNLKNLWVFDIKGAHIQNISLDNNAKLQYLFINCPQIKKISVIKCSTLISELITMYILEGTSVQVDSQTSHGLFDKYISIVRGSIGAPIQGYTQAISSLIGELHFSDDVSIKDKIMVIALAFTKRGLSHQFPKNLVSNVIGNIFSSKKVNKEINKEFFKQMFIFFIKNPMIKEIDFKCIFGESPPIQFLSILEEQITTNPNLANKYESYKFRGIKFTSEELKHIAQIIKKLTKDGLNFSFWNCFEQDQSQEFGEVIESLSQKKGLTYKIELADIQLDKANVSVLSGKLAQFQGRLNQLSISNCKLDDWMMGQLVVGLKKLRGLRMLDLSNNLITSNSFGNLKEILEDQKLTLTTLFLDGNNFQSDNIQEVNTWTSLKQLHLSSCNLQVNQIASLSSLLSSESKSQLTHLNLSNNELTPESFSTIKQCILSFSSLKELNLSQTIKEGTQLACLKEISEALASNAHLTTLDLSKNSLKNDGIKIIASSLQENTFLKSLIINEDSSFDNEGLKLLKVSLKNNKSLRSLELQRRLHFQEFDEAYCQLVEQIQKNASSGSSNIYQNLSRTPQLTSSLSTSYSFRSKREQNDYCRLGLSIDGGGMRGLIPATIINYLCNETKYEAHQIFDVIGGTSIGGLIALGSTGTLDGKTPIADKDGIVKIFEEDGCKIFNKSKFKALFNNLIDQAKYDSSGIESVLQKYFQNCKMSDVINGTNVAITAVKREQIQGKSSAKIFRSRETLFNDDKNFFMRDVARATSAAPTYFPSAEIKNINRTKSYSLVDGGVGQNNPSKIVLEDIKKEALNSGDENNFFLLSLGTGEAQTSQQLSQNAGALNIVAIINRFGDGASAYVESEIRQQYPDKYLRIQPNIPVFTKDADLDSTDPKLLDIYKQSALQEALKMMTDQSRYGPFCDRPIVEWFAENTARKRDTYI